METDRPGGQSQRGIGRRSLILSVTAAAVPLTAHAATYPDHPVRIVVPFSPGGGGDIIMRLLAQELTTRLGQTVLVENRTGAGGNVGTEVVAHAKPDGYSLLMANVAPMAINASIYPSLPYDPVKSFSAIAPIGVFPNILVVPPSLGVSSLAELIALGKSKPGGLTYASAGVGSITQLAALMMAQRAGFSMVHAAYRGGGTALTALAGKEVDLYFSSLPAALPFVKSGTLKALAVTSAQRSIAEPAIPTMAESGMPGFEAVTWIGLVGPAGMPAPIVERLHKELAEILDRPAFQKRLIEVGAEASHGTSAAFADYIRAEQTRWADAVRAANIKPEQ
jgi:tripartite-type tricarboxylate transporter receptor subunit TctC